MSPDDGRVDQESLHLRELYRLKYPRPDSRLGPAIKPLIDRIPVAKSLWQISPRSAAAGDPDDRVDKSAVVLSMSTRVTLTPGKQVLHQIPLFVREFVATHPRHPCQSRKSNQHPQAVSLPLAAVSAQDECQHDLVFASA